MTRFQKILPDLALTFDDVNIVPTISNIKSRQDVDISVDYTRNYKINIPLVASPMTSVCGLDMALKMGEMGGVGIVHRFMNVKDQVDIIKTLYSVLPTSHPISAAIGIRSGDLDRAIRLVSAGAKVILIDVAHGHHVSVGKMVKKLTSVRENENLSFDIIAGNVATGEGAKYLEELGADAIRVGVGGGSVCETRLRTGFGIPQITSLLDTVESSSVPVISCGGARYSGDIAKALATGASSVILGSMLAGTDEAPGDVLSFGHYNQRKKYKMYHGSASDIQKSINGEDLIHIEGTGTLVSYKGPVEKVVKDISDGIRSAFSYAGASDIYEYWENTKFVTVTTNGVIEAKPHLVSG